MNNTVNGHYGQNMGPQGMKSMQVALNGMLTGDSKQGKKMTGSQVISQPNNNKKLITASGGVSIHLGN